MNQVFQVIEHEWDDDDYVSGPLDDLVYVRSEDAIKVRDALNEAKVNSYRARVDLVCDAGGKTGKVRADYIARYVFQGDPTDIDALVHWIHKGHEGRTYYTVVPLRVFS